MEQSVAFLFVGICLVQDLQIMSQILYSPDVSASEVENLTRPLNFARGDSSGFNESMMKRTNYTSIRAYFAFFSMNSRRGGTSSPISMEKIWSATAALSIVT